ncbi:MAG: undecaprenyl-diphosphatase UppP [Desulfobacterales bacterium]|nr:undecaprenyl-diphosphatase UppP [Desulfobacterales bacterium]
MNIFHSIVLGIVQGLTEFLPVSSSGHLVLFQNIFGMKEPEIFFDLCLHFGTLMAIILIYFSEIKNIISSFFKGFRNTHFFSNIFEDKDLKLAFLIIIGCIPTAIIGLIIEKNSDKLFSSIFMVGIMLIITGLILFLTRFFKTATLDIKGFSFKKALIIGFVQGIAVIPGISRSGSTISTALFLGINKETAAKYSFLLSIPAIAGAELIVLLGASNIEAHFDISTFVGMLSAFVTGYLSLKLLIRIVNQGNLYIFAPYCICIGFFSIIFEII